jgi:plastocyanin
VTRWALAFLAAAGLWVATGGCGDSGPTTLVPLDLSAVAPADLGPEEDAGLPDEDGGVTAYVVAVGAGGGNRFQPQTLFVPAGTTVTWTWISGVHGVVSDDDPPAFERSPTQAGGQHQATFATPGQFGYHCSVHGRMMTGVIVVE